MATSLTKYIIILVIVYGIIYSIIYTDRIKDYLNSNWKTIRCYPHIIPVAGLSDVVDGDGFVNKTVKIVNKTFVQYFLICYYIFVFQIDSNFIIF